MEWVASTLHTTSADLKARVRFAERRNLVSARVPSHFRRSLDAVKKQLE